MKEPIFTILQMTKKKFFSLANLYSPKKNCQKILNSAQKYLRFMFIFYKSLSEHFQNIPDCHKNSWISGFNFDSTDISSHRKRADNPIPRTVCPHKTIFFWQAGLPISYSNDSNGHHRSPRFG